MQSNEKCIRAILKYIDENTGVEFDEENNISLKSISLLTVVNGISQNTDFTREEVAYNTLLCKKFGYIECKFEQNGNTFINGKCNIFDTTSSGEKFLNDNQD